MKIENTTPILIVDAIEPCLPFWIDVLGYEKQVAVPQGDALAFVLLSSMNAGELMLQTKKSFADDVPAIAKRKPSAILYVDVANLDEALAASKGAELVMPVRETFYGTREACIESPSGHLVLFAEKLARRENA